SSPTLSAARASEDEEVNDARDAADDKLDLERAAHALAHLRSLTLERDATDAHLVTERVRSDDAVASRDDFLAIVSHDVRNLLASMALSSEVLLQPPGQLL